MTDTPETDGADVREIARLTCQRLEEMQHDIDFVDGLLGFREAEELTCSAGHAGPWRYVEAIEVWREVTSVGSDGLIVDSEWRTGEGYDDGVEGSAYLLCWADLGGGRCVQRVELPAELPIEWE